MNVEKKKAIAPELIRAHDNYIDDINPLYISLHVVIFMSPSLRIIIIRIINKCLPIFTMKQVMIANDSLRQGDLS